jgi:ribosomal protein S18 acetylase RimI-like enzyme
VKDKVFMIAVTEGDVVVCRPALAQDSEQVMELCSHIWNGGDYIPLVWDEWLADPEGLLGVAELEGRVAGIFKLTKFQEGEWYMEGLRVHPDFQGRGVASHIHAYVVETWHKMGSGIIRLVTHSENVKIHHMCEQDGFRRIAEFIPHQADIIEGEGGQFTLVTADEVQKALDYVLGSPGHALSSGLIDLGWVYAFPQIKHIQEAIRNKHAWWWGDEAGFISIWVDEDEHMPAIQLLACMTNNLTDLLLDYRRLMGEAGYKTAVWIAPNQPQVMASLDKTGFKRTWDKSLYVYELRQDEGKAIRP